MRGDNRYIHKYKYNSIYIKTMTSYILFFTLIIFVVGGIGYVRIDNSNRDKIYSADYENLRQISKTLDLTMDKIDILSYNMVNDVYLQKDFSKLDIEEIYHMKKDFFSKFQTENVIDSIYIYYKNSGKIISKNDGVTDISQFEDNGFLEEYKKNYPLFLRQVRMYRNIVRNNEKVPVITVMRGFSPTNTNESGALVININADKLLELIDGSENNVKSIVILNENGKTLMGDKKFESELREMTGESRMKFSLGKTKYEAVSLISKAGGWKYFNVYNLKKLNGVSNKIKMYTFGIILICLAIWTAFSMVMAMNIYNPITKILAKTVKDQEAVNDTAKNEIELLDMLVDKIIISKDTAEDFYNENKNSILQGMLLSLCYGKVGEDDKSHICTVFEKMGFSLKDSMFAAVVIQIENDAHTISNINKCVHKYNSCNGSGFKICITYVQQNRIVGILLFREESSDVMGAAEEIRKYLKDECIIESSVGIGNTYDKIEQFSLSFHEALDALMYKKLSGENVIHISSFIKNGKNPKYYYPINKEMNMVEAIKLGNAEGALKTADEIYVELISSGQSMEFFSGIYWQVINGIIRALSTMGITYAEAAGNNYADDFALYSSLKTAGEMHLMINERIKASIDYINENRNFGNENMTNKIKKYVEEHIKDELSLTVFGEITGRSPEYVSKIFKKTAGIGLKEYITAARIETAKRMLVETDEDINKIAEKSGYDNIRSFQRTFRAVVGMSAGDYRKRMK